MRVAAVAAVLVGTLWCASPGDADVLFDEDFKGATTSAPFRVGGSTGWTPCLTASQDSGQMPIPGCEPNQPSIPAGGDIDGSGALRLTDNADHRSGYAIFDSPLPLTAGIAMTFDGFAYNGTRVPGFGAADGVSVFLKDAAVSGDAPGAFGGSLGYAQSNDDFDSPLTQPATIPGVPGGYLGVGIDEFGNFANDREARGFGCSPRADLGLHPQTVAVRGPGARDEDGDWLEGYCLRPPTLTVGAIDAPDETSREAAGVGNRFRLEIDPPSTPGARVRVEVDLDRDGQVDGVLDEPLPADPPRSFEFGFASSTGNGTNIHELQTVHVETLLPLPRFRLAKTHAGELVAGARGSFELQASLEPTPAGDARAPVVLVDRLPAGLEVAERPSGRGWDCSATIVGTDEARCTYAIAASDPVPAGTALPPLTLPVTIDPDVGGELVNVATLSGTEIPTPLRAEDRFVVERRADLEIQKLAQPGRVVRGSLLTFGLVVRNHGPSDARDVTVVDTLPRGVELVSAKPTTGTCTSSARTLRCELGTLRSGGSELILVATRVVSAAGTLVNTAVVTGSDPDPDPENNRDSTRTKGGDRVRPTTELDVQKRASRRTVRVGEPLTYTVRVTNSGRYTARDLLLIDGNSLPVRVLSIKPSAGRCRHRDRVVTCRLGDVLPGDSVRVRVRAAILRAGRSRNVAAAVSPGRLGGRMAVAVVRVRGGAGLRISKTTNRRVVRLGGSVRYRVTVRSVGPDPALGVRVCDRLPRSLRLVRAPGARGQRRPCWRLRALEAGRARTFRLTARATAATSRAPNRAFAEAANASRVRAARSVRIFDPCAITVRAAGRSPLARPAC